MPNVIRCARWLDHDQIIHLDTSPQLLVAPQFPDALFLPISVTCIPQTTTAYAGDANARLFFGARQLSDIPDFASILNDNLILNLLGYAPAVPYSGIPVADLLGQSFRLRLSGPLTEGGGKLWLITLYQCIYPNLPIS